MKSMFEGKKILLGVCGSVAAYKAIVLGRALEKSGATVRVALTANAAKFVTPLQFRSALRCEVTVDEFSQPNEWSLEHISWARWADTYLIAPATANVIGKCANGIADDFVTTTALAATCPVIFVPAMNTVMFTHATVQRNILQLKKFGYHVMETATGELACGEFGAGRFPDIPHIIDYVLPFFHVSDAFRNAHVLITAGPTHEYIDDVRFLSNASTGKMGLALARAFLTFGAKVTLVTGPITETIPFGAREIRVVSAAEMFEATIQEFANCNLAIMAAAVADYTPKLRTQGKIKKNSDTLTLEFARTRDILAELGKIKGKQLLIGFALESSNVELYAREKLASKNLDAIVANSPSPCTGFGAATNAGTLFFRDGTQVNLPLESKQEMAFRIASLLAAIAPPAQNDSEAASPTR